MKFELGKTYIVEVTENGITPKEEFDKERFFDKEHDELNLLTDEEKAVVVKERDKEWSKMIETLLDAIWFGTANLSIPKGNVVALIRDIVQLFTECPDSYKANCTNYDKTLIIDGLICHNERDRMEYYIEETLKDVRTQIETLDKRYPFHGNLKAYLSKDDVFEIIDRKIKNAGDCVTNKERRFESVIKDIKEKIDDALADEIQAYDEFGYHGEDALYKSHIKEIIDEAVSEVEK